MNTSIIKQVKSGRLAMLLLLLTTVLTSFAQTVKVSMEDFDIAPGEQRVVDINVTNDVPYGTDLGGDIYLPVGLKIVPNEDGDYLTRNMTRCTSSHALTAATIAENPSLIEGQIRFSLVSQSGKTLKGNEGAVVSFTVEATDELSESSTISLKDATIMNTSAHEVEADCEATVKNSSYVRPTLTAEGFSLTPSKEYTLSFSFNTATPVSAFEAHITLPEGLEPVLNEDEEYASFNMSRLTSSHTPASTFVGRTVNVMVSSSKSSNLKGEDGELFSITLRATGGLSEEAVIAVTPVIASTSAGTRIDIDGIEIKVSNPDIAAKATADEKISGLKNAFDEVKEAISALAESVQAMFQADIETVNGKVVAIEEALALDVTNGEVAANAETRDANIEEVKGLIASLKENAAKAQEDYNANEAQHTADLAAIAEVKVALEAAKAKVAEYAESVQAAFAETVAGIEAAVERLAATAEASYNNGTSVADAEALNEASAAVVADIEKLLADAAEAQKDYEEEVAKDEANEAQHTADLAAIAEVKVALEAAKAKVAEYAESVQAAFAETVAGIEAAVAELTATAEASYKNGTAVADAEALNEASAAVVADIEKLLAAAAAAQQAYEEEVAKDKANEAQHTADLAAIAEVKVALEAAKAKVAEYAESVQAAFAETVAGIEAAVERLAATAEASYNNGTSVADAEALNEASAAVVADIEKLLADAAAAQQAYEEEVAKDKANEAQHTADLAAIAEVKVALEAAKAKVAEYAESVQAAFAETVAGIEAAVERLSDTAEASYNNGTSVADAEALNEASATVVADIEKLLAAAAAAQQAYEEEVAKDKANEAQHTADLAAIAEVKVALEAAKAKVAEYAESVQAAVAEDIEAVEEAVAILEAQAEASYAAGTSVADAEELAEAVAAVQMQIAEILVKAEEAQQNVTKPGDINESGTVDIDDLTFIRDLALAKIDKESLTEKQKEAADLNGDGKFTVSDLVILNNIIIYGNPDGPVSKAKGSTTVMNAGTLAMYLSANRMNLTLDSKMAYAAIQMDVTMPYGVGLDEISFAGVSENVIVATNTLDNGTCRIIMYTSDNSAIMSEDSSLLNIVLTGEGRGIVNIDNIIAAAANGKSYNLSAISGSHTIVTGISSIEINGEKGCYVYDANGVASKTLKKGVNIVRNSAGDVKKVFVK